MQPVAVIQIAMMPDGSVTCQAQCPNLVVMMGMLEFSKTLAMNQHAKQAAGSGIEVAPAGFDPPVNRITNNGQ